MGVLLDLLKKAVQDGKVFVNGGIVEEPVTLESIGNDKKVSEKDKILAAGLAKRRQIAEKRCEAGLAENIKEDKKLNSNIENKEVKSRKRTIPKQEVESIKTKQTKQTKKSEPVKESKEMEISE